MGVDSTIFSDDELTRIWERVDGARNDTIKHEAALALMARQLLTNAAKLHDVAVAGDSNKLSQVFDHYKALYALYLPSLESVLGTASQVSIATLRPVKHQTRETP